MMMKFDAVSSELLHDHLRFQFVELKQALHDLDLQMTQLFTNIQSSYTTDIQEK